MTMQSQPDAGCQSMATTQTMPKFSRYRSVRQAATKRQVNPEIPILPPALRSIDRSREDSTTAGMPKNEMIGKSMSRYKTSAKPYRSNPTRAPAPMAHSAPSPVGSSRDPSVRQNDSDGASSRRQKEDGPRTSSSRNILSEKTAGKEQFSNSGKENDGVQTVDQLRRNVQTEDDGRLTEEEREKNRKDALKILTMGERQPRTARTARESSKMREQENQAETGGEAPPRLQKYKTSDTRLDTGHSAQATTSTADVPKRQSWKERMGISRAKANGTEGGARQKDETSPTRKTEPGGGTIFPGIDAPVSAVNAGERRVLVKCNSSSIMLPVTPTTRAKDIIYSATTCLSESIDPKNSILLESFSQLGLERPLRRYEHVRDVLNSWANDSENSLIITVVPGSSDIDKLDIETVPSQQPRDVTFYLYHSQRPGKWDKRYVTLHSDGQVVVSKKSGQELTNICHLSDFDIYSPTRRQLSKKIKPPKKICFAVKSQQKSSMFLSTENFAHFFSTNDEGLAQNWYDAVHKWRSWYLVHVLGEGKQDVPEASNVGPGDASRPQHQRTVSTESSPYILGSFKPLISLDSFNNHRASTEVSNSADGPNSRELYSRRKTARDHAPPPSSFPKRLVETESIASKSHANPEKAASSDEDDVSVFAPSGLLGRTYSQRQKAQREREREEQLSKQNMADAPIFSHGLLGNSNPNASQPTCPSSDPPTTTPVADLNSPTLGRSTSIRQKPKPLIDLTPVYQEPPQHVRKAQRLKVEPGVPLVDIATGPEVAPGAIVVPSATTWRRPDPNLSSVSTETPLPSSPVSPRRRTNTAARGQHHQPLVGSIPQSSPDHQFAPSSLLGRSITVSGTGGGRGVATGDRRADKPLIDLTPKSHFTEGSLLRSIEP